MKEDYVFTKAPYKAVVEDKSKQEKKPKKMLSYSDDMKKSNTDIKNVDNDLLEKLEKFLPITKEVKMTKVNETVTTADSFSYLENNGSINYNKLLTDEVLATDKLLVESAKKNLNIAGKSLKCINVHFVIKVISKI